MVSGRAESRRLPQGGGGRRPSRAVGAEAGGPRRETYAHRQAGRPGGGRPVVRDRAFDVARQLEQVRPHGVQPVMAGQAFDRFSSHRIRRADTGQGSPPAVSGTWTDIQDGHSGSVRQCPRQTCFWSRMGGWGGHAGRTPTMLTLRGRGLREHSSRTGSGWARCRRWLPQGPPCVHTGGRPGGRWPDSRLDLRSTQTPA
jgi:hypothetical protein